MMILLKIEQNIHGVSDVFIVVLLSCLLWFNRAYNVFIQHSYPSTIDKDLPRIQIEHIENYHFLIYL